MRAEGDADRQQVGRQLELVEKGDGAEAGPRRSMSSDGGGACRPAGRGPGASRPKAETAAAAAQASRKAAAMSVALRAPARPAARGETWQAGPPAAAAAARARPSTSATQSSWARDAGTGCQCQADDQELGRGEQGGPGQHDQEHACGERQAQAEVAQDQGSAARRLSRRPSAVTTERRPNSPTCSA